MGFEIYLKDATVNAEKMWNTMLEAGKKHNLKVIAPGHHRRIEAGILSYGADFDIETNPYECGLGWQVDFERGDFVGMEALKKIQQQGEQSLTSRERRTLEKYSRQVRQDRR